MDLFLSGDILGRFWLVYFLHVRCEDRYDFIACLYKEAVEIILI